MSFPVDSYLKHVYMLFVDLFPNLQVDVSVNLEAKNTLNLKFKLNRVAVTWRSKPSSGDQAHSAA
jgi:hypothetical protein